MEARRDSEFDEIVSEVPPLMRHMVKDFLAEQNLHTLDDMASLHQDDLTEAFKSVKADFTLGHRAVVRRLCAAARIRIATMTQLSRNVVAQTPQETSRQEELQGAAKILEKARSPSPASRQYFQHSENEQQGSLFAWENARSSSPASRQRFQRAELQKSSSANRDPSPVMQCRTPNRPAFPKAGVFSRAGARTNDCCRETTWSQLADRVDNKIAFHEVNNATSLIRPSSPRASIGKSRRPEVFSQERYVMF